MKPFLRILLGSALALLSGAAAFAAASSAPSGITSTPGSAAPNEVVSLSVTLTNSAAATTAPTNQNDFPAGGSANVTFTFTHTVTGFSFTRTGTVSTTSAIAENGGTGVLSGNFTIPTITTQAGAYRASVVVNSVSSGTFSATAYAAPGTTLTITGKPDLKITNITYPAGTAYRGGDVIPMTLSYTNLTSSNGGYNVPYVPGVNSDSTFFRIEVILSSNPTFGDSDDFLLTSHDVSTSPFNADSADTTVSWNQILPGNFAGTYYVMAKIDALSGVSESIDNDLTINGNNTWFSPDTNAARISLLPTNFPTVYWASTSGNAYSDNPAITADGRYTAFASDSTTLGTGDTNVIRDIFLFDNQTATVRRLSLSQQGAQSNGASNNPAISSNGTYVAFSSDATNLALDDTNGFSDIYVVNALTGVITRVSLSTAGVQSNGSNFKPAISATGRYVAWESNATNLIVAGTAVGVTHIYLRDRDVSGSGTFDTAGNVSTVLVSQSSGSVAGDGNSIQASISGGGRYVAFASDATNLVAGDANALRDIFVRDVTGGTTTRISVATGGTESAGGASRAPSINQNNGSADDGRYVAFGSEATNLVAGDANAVSDIFVHDRNSTTTVRVSVSSAGVEASDPSSTAAQRLGSVNPSISSTGRYVAFASLANNLTAGDSVGRSQTNDSNSSVDIFVVDRDVNASGTFDTGGNIATTMVSKNRFGYQTLGLLGTPSTAASDLYPVISGNGRWVGYPSDAENTAGLVHGATNRTSPDSNTFRDVFLHDRRINALPSATTPPSVSITSPVTATSYPVNSAITVVGSASAPAGTITSVQFFVNGTSLGTDTSFPYNATWTPTAVGSFALSALVTDSFGNQATSANVSITIAAVSPTSPTVSISSPANGASLFANGPTTVSASATDSDGTIASVQFFANGVSIGTDTTFPYSVQFTPVATGSYTLTAVATDNGGNQTTSTGAGSPSVTVTNLSAPSISITSPSPVQINSATTITATTTTAGSIASVQFLANGTTLGTVTSAPFTFSWTPTAAGAYTLSAVATDNLGSQTTSATISVTVSAGASPTVSISSPTAGTVNVNIQQTVTATAADSDGTIASVQFSVNGVALGGPITAFPFTTTWTPTTSGTYTLLAVATDNLGNQTTSSSVSMTVTSGTAPTVAISSPTNGASLANGGTATITATATANTGTITSVRFFANGVLLATDTTFPYSATFSTTANGAYALTAVATDTVGNQTTSAAVTLNVAANQSPTASITAPAAGTVGVGSANTVTATAADADGSIASVQFFANGASLGTDTTSPYSVTWTPTVAGSVNLTAVATDDLGSTVTTAAVAMTVSGGNQPTASVTAPATGSSLAVNSTATVTATASAVAPLTVASVQLFANGVSLGSDTVFPYTATWTPTATGTYSLTATVVDSAGNQATSTANTVTVADNASPTVSVTAPANAATVGVGSSNTVTATAADTDGTVASVQFFANGTSLGTDTSSPYTATWTPVIAGTYAITAVATDNLGATTTSSTNSVTVTGGNAPTTAVTAPANASSLAVNSTAAITATATAVAPATIASVQFLANGVSLGSDTAFPYSVNWTPTANGTYSLTTLATDSNGNQATSSAVTVTVAANASPAVAITAPAAGTVGVGSSNSVTATATDTDGTIASVQFFANGTSLATDTTSPYTATFAPTVAGSYSLTAVATDNLGATTTSAAVALTVTGGNQPSVNVTAPAAAAVLAIGSTSTVTATATAVAPATIASVQFFANGVSIGTDTTFPYTAPFAPTATGTYSLTALAIDTAGNQATSSAVSVTVTANTAPSVGITSPLTGATVGVGSVNTVTATATDTEGTIASVQFFSNGTSLGSDTTAPYTSTFTPTVAGTYSLTAVATDDLGLTTTSGAISVTVTGGNQPTVAVTSPANGASLAVGGTATVTATATAATGTIASVQFFANGASLGTDTTFPYSATFTPGAAGTFALTALAIDTSGNQSTSTAINVTVAANVAPTVTITAPANGGTVGVGSTNSFTATATDSDGSIVSVQFLVNGNALATDTTSPYSATFAPTSAGTYSLTAIAADNLGATTTSATTTVTVAGGNAPTVSIGSPAAGVTVPVGSSQIVTASATAATGTIASVQFFANGVALGTDTTFPYASTWTPVANGSYSLTALATDTAGNTALSAAVTVTVAANTPGSPTIALLTPPAGTTLTVNKPVVLVAGAADPDGTVSLVEFFAGGQFIGSTATAPYYTLWIPTTAGTYSLTAVATDNQNNRTTTAATSVTIVAEVGSSPVTALTFNNPALSAPATAPDPTIPVNVSYGSKLIFAANAVDAGGTIAGVRFYVNGTQIANDTAAPFYTTHQLDSLGTVVVTALVTDSSGNALFTNPLIINSVASTSASASTVSLVSPLNASTYVVGQVIDFSAVHNFGSVTPPAIDFFIDGNQATTLTAEPYLFTRSLTRAGTYDVHAVARIGTVTTVSSVAQITVTSNTAPTVTIAAPATGTTATFGVPTTVEATATDPDGTISAVQFFANGVSIGTDNSFPYSVSFNPAATGTYLLTAIATDNGGNQSVTATAVSLTVAAATLPTASITAPTAGAAIAVGSASTITATATATAPATVARVQFFANGLSIGTDDTFPYSANFSPAATGAYALTVVATDSLGNQTTSATVNVTVAANVSPTAAITAPANLGTVGVGVATTITATATDSDGTVASVRFFANSTLLGTSSSTSSPYSFSWTPTIPGSYALTAISTDNLGATTTSATVNVTATGGSAPSVSITAPAGGSAIAVNSSATITATATAVTGTIASVQFFANGISLGTDTTFPYSATWSPVTIGTYSLTALTTDTSGNQATSSAVSVTVAANVSPTISIGSPINAATVPVGTATTITATAADTDGTIAGVQFFVNGGLIGTDTTAPYSVSWTPTINGSYTLTATATDNSGASTTSASIGVTAGGGNAPTVSLTAPLAGSVAVGSANAVTALANATVSGASIAGVQFFANNASIGTASTFPHTITWTPTVNGTYALTAVATDTAGNQATSSSVSVTVAANQLPTVALTAPANGATVGVGTGTAVTANASDNDGTVTRVQFFATPTGGTATVVGTSTAAPYAATWTPTTAGTYTVTAVATDNVGGTTTSTAATVTVSGGLAPLVTLASPGANVANGTVTTLTATATAATGTIASVQFFANGASLGTDTTFPYTATWTPTANGNISLTAVATDTAGNQTTSAAVIVAVAANVAPTVSVTAPANAATVGVGSSNTVTATASDTDGSVVSVQFFANGVSLGAADTTSPYSATWTPTVAGTYALTAVATDNLGITTTSTANSVTVSGGAAPVVTVASPGATVAVNSTVALTATASATAPATIASVQFFANGTAIGGADTTFPYGASWTPTANGTYSITALAIDSAGNQATSAAVSVTVGANQLPTVSVTAPANAASVGVGSVNTVTATAADADGSVVSVQFFANGTSLGTDTTSPYTASWTPTIAGTYALTAVATDNLGATATSTTNTVTVAGGNAPTVSVTAPANGSALAVNTTNTVTATASATLAGATIARVEFFANGVSLGVDTTFPYAATWTPTALGTYAITALATDSSGNQSTSTANSVTVSTAGAGPAPSVSLTSPNSGATYVVGQPVTMGATVGLGSSFITGVQFFVNGISIGGGSTPPNGQGAAPFWTASWTPAAPGSYTFTAVVTDANGVQVTSAPISITVSALTVPTIVIASPSNATSLAPNLPQTLVANVGVTNASVLNVQFFANNVSLGTVSTFPYSVNWTPATTGDYSVIAVLTTSTGVAVTSAPVVYSVATGTVPTVSVTTPLPAATVNVGFPQNIVATAAATQAGAVIRDVQFFVNGVSLSTDATFPFGATWTPLVPGAYSITSVATDTLGNRQTSTAVSVTATAVSTTAPSVNIVTPANLATVSIGTSPAPVVTITANATDPDGTIASVQFFANGLSLGTVNAFPYTISWTPTAEGTYSLTAVAIDNGGNQSTSAAVTVTASAAGAPTVTLSTSATGNTSTANSPVTLTANAVAAFGRNVTSVQFFANGTAIGAPDTVSPYSTTWTPLAPGVYAITATATDNLSVSGTSAATNVTITSGTPPSISITSPGNGSTIAVSTVQTFTATATPVAPASITNVQFLVNGVSIGNDNSSPYSVSYTPLSLGSYTLTAVATDSLTNTTTSSAVNFTVVAAVGPTVVITAPTNGTSGNVGSAVTVSANPTSGGTITSVQFFANGVSIGTDTSAPYSVSWIPTAGGPVNLTAVATDSNNVTGAISTPATYTVLTPPATVSITGPGAGATLPVNVPQTIFASANVTNGTVVSVQFFVNGLSVGTDTTFPFSAPWTPTTTGTFALTAKSTDNFGTITDSGTTTGVVTVTVTGGTAPSVSLSSPANNSTLSVGLPQTLVANATAVNGTIANVRFLANSVVLGTDNTFPYNLNWTPTAVGTYEIIVVATDTLGNETRSAVTTLTVAPVSAGAPAVSLTAPAAGASLPVGVTTLLAANATDADGTIVSVEFLSNGVSLGTDTVFPYNFSFTPGATGTYVLTAIATDNGGNITTSTAVTVTVTGGTAPSVAIDGPANGVTLGVNAPQTITATATSTTGFIKDVQFFLNGQPLSTDSSYPYAADWNPTAIGTYTLTARATDNLGNITDSAPVVVTIGASAAPTVSVTNPPNGSSYTVGAALNLTADAADSDGTITGVQFFVNGLAQGGLDSVSPYTGTWTPGSVGVYTLTARATDNNGNVTTSAPVTVTIGANAAPTVALTSPAAGTYSLGNLVLVSASANDSDGTVASVQFFANGLSIGTSTAAPFNTSWRPTLAGTFRLTAVATDNAGNVTTSAVVSVTITSTAAPAVTIMNPIVGQPYGVGNAIPFTANPTGGNGPISQVQFFVNGTSVGVDSTSPYASTFTPNAPGTYSLLAIATDSAGLSSSSSASINIVVTGNSAPAVVITSPPSGTSVNGGTIVNLTAIATDTDGTVASVRFLANGNQVGTAATSIPFGTAWVPSAAGTYSVTAQATDNSGNVTNSAPISVTVVANAVPTVTLTSPANGATVRVGSGTTLAATAADTDGTIASVQFFANGLSIGTDSTSPYSTAWTPGAEGIYRITAVALDNSGAATTSGTVLALAVSATSGGTDTVYTGTYAGSGEIGRFATISIRGKSAAFIGFSQTQPAKIYFFDSLAVDLGGGFFLPDSLGRAVISGSVSDTGVSGTLDAGRINFIGPVTFPSATATVASGLYTGNLTDRAGSLLTAIVGPDGSIFLYATDGANFRDAGAGAVNSTGGFIVTTSSGNRFSGRADPATGFLTGTLTGGPGGTFTAAIASGVSFSDGFLRNLSTRGPVGTGNDVLVAGFAVAGNAPKRVLIRAIGPSLAAFGITGALADTRLDLFNGNTLVVANDNWGGAGDVIAASNAVGAFPLATTSLDSVVVATLPPGLYTAQVSGVGGRTGVALVELYDLDTLQAFSTQKLTNVATRGVLTAAQNQIIAGFMVSGTTSKKVLIRAVGPTLGRAPFNVPGTLADPMLRLVRGDGSVVRENDNWETGNDAALISEASAKVGAFALSAGAKDCAILINLPPGTYSAQVSGAAPGTGTVLVEVYEVP